MPVWTGDMTLVRSSIMPSIVTSRSHGPSTMHVFGSNVSGQFSQKTLTSGRIEPPPLPPWPPSHAEVVDGVMTEAPHTATQGSRFCFAVASLRFSMLGTSSSSHFRMEITTGTRFWPIKNHTQKAQYTFENTPAQKCHNDGHQS